MTRRHSSQREGISVALTFPVHELTIIGGDDEAAIITLRLILLLGCVKGILCW